MDEEICEARIWKPNFAKITSVLSQKQTWAKVYFRLKQSLFITNNGSGQKLEGADFFPDGVWGLGIWIPSCMEIQNKLFQKYH